MPRRRLSREKDLHHRIQKCSVMSVELTLRQARELLAGWRSEQETVATRRDEVVRAAVEAGLSKSEISRITGIARTTVDRIIGADGSGS